MLNTTYDDDKLLHSGRKGMKWGQHIFGRSRASAFSSRRRRRLEGGLSEHERELAVLNLYRNRDRVSTKVLKDKVSRIETEQKLKKLAEAPAIARAEAKKKRQQARLQFAAKIASAALDVYSKWPNQSVAKKFDPVKQEKELAKAIKDFEYRKGMAKAFKDVPLTFTKFDDKVNVDTSKLFQSVNVAGVDVYIPETIQNRFMIQHSGRKGMKWGMNIFGRRDRYTRNNFSKAHYQTYKYARERVLKGKLEHKLSKRIHKLTKELYNSQPTEQNKVLTNIAYDASKDAKATRKKYKATVKKIFNKYSETDFDLRGGLEQSAVDGTKNDDLLHSGRKGMKWRKKKIGAMPDLDDVLYNLDKKHIDEHVEEAKRDVASANKIVEDARDRIKRAAAAGKKPSQQDIDAYNRHSKSKADSSKILELRRKHAKEARENHLKEKAAKLKGKSSMKHSATGGELNGVYIPSNEEVLLQYGKRGIKWRKKQGVANDAPFTDEEKRADAADVKAIEYLDRSRKEKRADHLKTLEGIYGKGKVTKEQLDKFQDSIYKSNRAMYELKRKHRSMNANHASRNALYDKLRRGKGAVKA